MKKRHEIIALLAAAAGLGMGSAADAAVIQHMTTPAATVVSDQETMSDQMLSRMIQLAEAKGHDRSDGSNAGGNSKGKGNSGSGGEAGTSGNPSTSPQGNGNARGFEHSENPNAAGNPEKPEKGTGKGRGKGNNHNPS